MGLIKNCINGRKYRAWSKSETFSYFVKGVARELKIAPSFFAKLHASKIAQRHQKEMAQFFLKRWLKQNGEESYFDFGICKLPDVSASPGDLGILIHVFEDVLLFPCFLDDNYHKTIVEYFDQRMEEGPYGYIDGDFNVRVEEGDVVIDAGAWIGDFSAYAASKKAIVYAFEPVKDIFQLLCKTKELNNTEIFPIQKGLGSCECEINIAIDKNNTSINSLYTKKKNYERIHITTLDKFAEENQLQKIDFIKADIEGAEREMLRGATNVLKTFAPKLAICTYHLLDDPETLEKIILDANPNYTVIHLRHKLMAAVVNK